MADFPYNTTAWARLRKAHLSIEPLCRACYQEQGRMIYANHVDHIVPISAGGDPFPSHDGLQSLCAPCHSAKTARGVEAGAIRTTKPRRGCDANGNPIDPAHPWKKSLRADDSRPRMDHLTQLVSSNIKGARNG